MQEWSILGCWLQGLLHLMFIPAAHPHWRNPGFPSLQPQIFKQSQKLNLFSYESWRTFSYYFQLCSTSSAFVAAKLLGWNSKELRFNVYDHIQWANQCASEYCPGEFLLFPLRIFFFSIFKSISLTAAILVTWIIRSTYCYLPVLIKYK